MFCVKKSDGMNVFGVFTSLALIVTNLFHVIWTWCLCAEQAETGWGYGTNLEMAVLYPWICEALTLPVILAGIIYFALHIWKRSETWISITTAVLFALYIAQIFITNLFIFF